MMKAATDGRSAAVRRQSAAAEVVPQGPADPDVALPSEHHPADTLLREDRLPHIWCPECGLGIALKAYVRALEQVAPEIPLDTQVCVSGIGCTGRIAGYVNLDSYHTTHGRAIPFATGLKLGNPQLSVTVFTGDGDLLTIGGNHFVHAARRNFDINIFLVNNFTYGMTGGQFGATTPQGAISATTPYGNVEEPMNVPALAEALGVPYVARWTTLHVRQLARSLERALRTPGFTLVEIISPCPPGYGRANDYRTGTKMMQDFRAACRVDPEADVRTVGLPMRQGDPIVCGDFVYRPRPSYLQRHDEQMRRAGIHEAEDTEADQPGAATAREEAVSPGERRRLESSG